MSRARYADRPYEQTHPTIWEFPAWFGCAASGPRGGFTGDLYAPWTVRYVIELEEQKFMESLASANGR